MIELRNILMATDFTRFSKQGRLMARDLCRRFKETLHLLHVIDDRAHGLPDAAARVVEPRAQNVDRHIAQEQQAIVKLWAELFPDYKKNHKIEFAAVFGHPGVQIVE